MNHQDTAPQAVRCPCNKQLDLLLEYARLFSIGMELPIECVTRDPRDPYEFLHPTAGSEPAAPVHRELLRHG